MEEDHWAGQRKGGSMTPRPLQSLGCSRQTRASVRTLRLLALLGLAVFVAAVAAPAALADGFGAGRSQEALSPTSAAAFAATSAHAAAVNPGRCIINSLPSFTESGEQTPEGHFPKSVPSSITDIVEVECDPTYAGTLVEFSSQELVERCHGISWSSTTIGAKLEPSMNTITVPLDNDGAATVVLLPSGPCAPGESLITADLLSAPNTTVATGFTVLPPRPTEVGVFAIPSSAVESDTTSSVATIIQVEFPPEYAENLVSINLRQLYAKCRFPHIWWFGPSSEEWVNNQSFYTVMLDNDGTAFALVVGGQSCSAGKVLVEASLEEAPYTTVTTEFEIKPPEPTLPEQEFTIEKRQKLEGQKEYTKSPLTGKLGETVEYQITVTNTGNVTIPLSSLIDPKCEHISVGPELLAPGAKATYTCTHDLTSIGTWTNVATIESEKEKKESNEVEVKVPPGEFTIEKLQRLPGEPAYTKEKLTGHLGETVEYQIVVHNTGIEPETLTGFSDEHCEEITGGASKLAPGESTIFTCKHKLTEVGTWINQASIMGNEKPKTSNQVEVVVLPKPGASFEIEKLQRLEPGAPFTKEKLTGQVGQVVEYEIIVRNTGEVALKFSKLVDEHCENISPAGPTEVAPTKSVTYTCTQKLTKAGTFTNVAVIEGNEGTGPMKSKEVEVVVPEKAFTIEKLERVGGKGNFERGPLIGQIGETIEYEIIVKNTGTVKLTLTNFTDPVCEGLAEGSHELEPGQTTIYTCVHKITQAGQYINVASITGEGVHSEKSNEVIVNVPGFTIEKLQRLSAKGGSFVTTPLQGIVGETVEYEIKVKNTGNISLNFSEFKDANCEGIKGGASKLAPGEEAVYTCVHKLASTGEWMNQASIVGSEGTGGKPSNVVVVTAATQGKKPFVCEQPNANYVLIGAVGPKTKPFTVRITAKGIKEITFYLGSKKLKTLKASQAKHGEFTIKIDPRKLSVGHKTVSIKAALTCGGHIVRSSSFVHTKPSKLPPSFTG